MPTTHTAMCASTMLKPIALKIDSSKKKIVTKNMNPYNITTISNKSITTTIKNQLQKHRKYST